MAEANPFDSFGTLNNDAGMRNLFRMREMSAANRMEPMPHSRYQHGGGFGGGMMSALGGQGEPDYSAFTYDPQANQAASKYLGQYGLSPLAASQVNPNAMLPNSGFFGRHPGLARGLEGAMFGAAATQGSNTWGEGISNVARGLIEGPQLKRSMVNRQFATPFQAANMMENLEDRVQKRQLQEADIQHLRAVNEHLVRGDEAKATQLMETNRHQEAMEGLKQQQENAERPIPTGYGSYVYNPGTAFTDKLKSPWDFVAGEGEKQARRTASRAANAGPWFTFKDSKGVERYGRAHENEPLPSGAKLIQGDYDTKRENKLVDQRNAWVESTLKGGRLARILGPASGLDSAEKKTKALQDIYDKYIAPNEGSPMPEAGGTYYNPQTQKLEKR